MAGFLIPFGQALGEFGTGITKGNDVREDLRWKKLNNDLLQQQIQYGGPAALKLYMKNATQRSKNLEIGQLWAQRAQQIATTNPLQAQKWQMASQELLGTDGMGSLEDPTQIALNLGIRQPDVMADLAKARYYQIINPPIRPYVAMGPDGQPIVGGIQQPLDPATGARSVGTVGLPAMGGASLNMMPPPGTSGADMGPLSAPPIGVPPMGIPPPMSAPPMTGPPPVGGPPPGTPGFAGGHPYRPPGPGAEPPAPSPATVAATRAAVTRVADPLDPPIAVRAAKSPPPIPSAWGGTGKPLNAYLRPKLDTNSSMALSSLNSTSHQMELLYRYIRSIPPSLRPGKFSGKWDTVLMKAGISSGPEIDALLSQVGAARASLIAGFQAAGKTRAMAAIKMVDDHYPKLTDESNLLLHKLEQLIRPDGYLNFARNSILYGPTAATAMAPIDEPIVAPPGAAYDATKHWTFPSGNKGIMLDGIPYRQDTDGYWVQIR